MTTQKQWRPVAGYEGRYDVSSEGRVRSWVANQRPHPYVLLPFSDTCGLYLSVGLTKSGRTRKFRVHALVLSAFVGQRPPDMETRHLDGNSMNNALTNLRWGTHAENTLDQARHGTGGAAQTQCIHGHPFDAENTYVRPRGGRACRTCYREWDRLRRIRKRSTSMIRNQEEAS